MVVPGSQRTLADGSGVGPQVGELAPTFDLRHTFERSLSLEELLSNGPVAIFFYVFDFGHV